MPFGFPSAVTCAKPGERYVFLHWLVGLCVSQNAGIVQAQSL